MIAAGARIPAIAAAQRAVYTSLAEVGGTPTAAYSVRQVNKSYSGPVVKVRRFDGSEQDFGFLGEDLDTTSLLRFVKNEDAPLPVDRGDAVGAYSVRKVSSTYTGSVVKVRRTVSAVTVEADVAFDDADTISLNSAVTITSGTSSATTLGEFVANAGYTDVDSLGGAQDAFVAVWYDQSGGGNHASQSTAGSQPKIVSSGALVTENGKVALDFDGTDDTLTVTASYVGTKDLSIVTVSNLNDLIGIKNILNLGDIGSNSNYFTVRYSDTDGAYGFQSRDGLTGNAISISPLTTDTRSLLFSTRVGTTTQIHFNGQSGTAVTDAENGVNITGSLFISSFRSVVFTASKAQEYLVYTSDKSSTRASIEDEINRYYSIYTEAVKDGFVTTWYDQSGSGYHATQATAGSQPKIVSAGTLVTENGKVALDFDSDFLTVPSSTATFKYLHDGTASSVMMVATAGKVADPNVLLGYLGNNGGSISFIGVTIGHDSRSGLTDRYLNRVGRGGAPYAVQANENGKLQTQTQLLITTFFDADNATASDRYKAGVNGDTLFGSNTETALPSTSNASFNMQIGALGNNQNILTGFMQEVLFFNTDKSSLRTAIEDNINAYFNIY